MIISLLLGLLAIAAMYFSTRNATKGDELDDREAELDEREKELDEKANRLAAWENELKCKR